MKEDSASSSSSSSLSRSYKVYVLYEAVAVNLVGGLTLVFQCSLQRLEAKFLERHPDCPQVVADVLFGHFWLRGTLNCDTDAARASTFMIAGWLFIASTLQVFVNLDDLRRRLFPKDDLDPRGIKIVCLYAFFICDWYWVALMAYFRDVITVQQFVGSAVDIAIRLYFVADTDRIFKADDDRRTTKKGTPPVAESASVESPVPVAATTATEAAADRRRRITKS